MVKRIEGGVTAKAFRQCGIYAGIKRKRKDMALVFTRHRQRSRHFHLPM